MQALRTAFSPRATGWVRPFSHFEQRLLTPPAHELAAALALGLGLIAFILR